MHPDQIRREAETLLKASDVAGALQRFDALVASHPDDAAGWFAYGRALFGAKRITEAIKALERTCELAPTDIAARTELGGACERACRLDEAIHWHAEALALAPDSLVLRLNHAFIWPVVADSADQIDFSRQRCLEAFEHLRQDPTIQLYTTHTATNHCFGLSYHGIDDRALLERYARLVINHVGVGGPAAGKARPAAAAGTRLRLGFLSNYFYDHSNARAFEGLLKGLDRDRFELVLIHLSGSRDDAVRLRLEGSVDRVLHCSDEIALAWQQLRALQLDLLFFTDIGMNAALPALLSCRCAPVQVTGWGFPRTSGFPTVDYYLSGEMVEPPEGQEHYSETLVRLAGLPCRYLSENLQLDPLAQEMGRAYFLLPEEEPLVGCLQTYWKLHPDFDAVLERIAQAVPDAWFVFLEPTFAELADVFLSRLRRHAPTAAKRFLPLASVGRGQYAALAGCLDVLLDTLHFGSGISFYESIWTGTPIVTVEGPFLRSRFVAGGYRLMGLQDAPVARSPEQMAELTIALLRDHPRRERLRRRIAAAARAHLFDRMDMVTSFEAFACEAIERSRLERPAR